MIEFILGLFAGGLLMFLLTIVALSEAYADDIEEYEDDDYGN